MNNFQKCNEERCYVGGPGHPNYGSYHVTGAFYWKDERIRHTTNCWFCGKEIQHDGMIKTLMDKAVQFIEDRLKPPLLHGDENHQQWLREELRKWIPGLHKLLDEVQEQK